MQSVEETICMGSTWIKIAEYVTFLIGIAVIKQRRRVKKILLFNLSDC